VDGQQTLAKHPSGESAELAGSPVEIRSAKPEPNGFKIFEGLDVEPQPAPLRPTRGNNPGKPVFG
jgi:hypothetical protein